MRDDARSPDDRAPSRPDPAGAGAPEESSSKGSSEGAASASGASARKKATKKPVAKKNGTPKRATSGIGTTGEARVRADDVESEGERLEPPPPVPGRDELLDAMRWAFEGEEMATPALLERFAEHAHYLLTANQSHNLTAITEPRELAAKHYLDSWRLAMWMPLMGRKVLDLGSGAGFPGIPLALAEPAARFSLVESIQKKAEFIARSIEDLSIKNATAFTERAEEHLIRESYDVVIVRAVSSVRENVRVVRKVRHSLKDMVMYKGPSWSREVRAGEREAERLGFRLGTVWEHELPGEMGKRAILVYRAPGGQGM